MKSATLLSLLCAVSVTTALTVPQPIYAQEVRIFNTVKQKLAEGGSRSASRMAMVNLSRTGDCLRDLGRLEESAETYKLSIELAKKQDDHRQVAALKANLGSVRMRQQRYDDALTALNEARETFAHLGEPGSVATAWHQIGLVYEEAQQYEAAEHAYQQSLKI